MTLYPILEPYETGMLDVGDGNRIYWEACGNPAGKPAVFLHGGPGGGCIPAHRGFFDPSAYRVILFDQRGCGQSTPHVRDFGVSLETNTTWHLVADIERLREHLGIQRWLVFGGSWGSTLGLAYAQAHPDRVTELVLRGIWMVRPVETRWVLQEGAPRIFPDAYEKLVAPIPPEERDDLVAAFDRRLNDPDPDVRLGAAKAWSHWEASTASLRPNAGTVAMFAEPDLAVAIARLEVHYITNNAFLGDDQLLHGTAKIRDIPGVIVHGRYDMCTPMVGAWDLHQAWPEADFTIVNDAGHAGTDPGVLEHLIAATDRFATRREPGDHS